MDWWTFEHTIWAGIILGVVVGAAKVVGESKSATQQKEDEDRRHRELLEEVKRGNSK